MSAEANGPANQARRERTIWEQIERPLVWLVEYPLLTLTYLLFVAVAWNLIGGGFGLVHLFWHQDWAMQWLVGAATSLLVGEVLSVRYLLPPPRARFHHVPSLYFWRPKDDPVRELGRYLFAIWLPALVILGLPAIPMLSSPKPGGGIPLVVGLASGVAYQMISTWVIHRFRVIEGILRSRFFPRLPGVAWGYIAPEDYVLHARAIVFGIELLIGFAILLVMSYVTETFSPVVTVAFFLGFVLAVYGFITFHLRGLQILIGLLLVITGIWFNRMDYKLRFSGLEAYYGDKERVALEHYGKSKADDPRVADRLIRSGDIIERKAEEWKLDRPVGSPPRPKLVVIAVGGGGSRAAVWTCAVLEKLEQEHGDIFPGQVRVITGASGGMVGAGYYVSQLDASKASRELPIGTEGKKYPLAHALARDSLSPVVRDLCFHDLPGIWWPGRLKSDRGHTLEQAWIRNTQTRSGKSPLEQSILDLKEGEEKGWRPALIFSPMLVEDARRLLISNLDLEDICVTGPRPDPVGPFEREYSISAVEFFRLFPNARLFQVATAARMSASFPIASPAVNLPTDPPVRVVDAGYYDNYGVDIASVWLYRYREEICKHTSGVLVIEVRAHETLAARTQLMASRSDAGWQKWKAAFSEVTSPVEGVLNMRDKSPWYRNDESLQMLADYFGKDFFRTIAIECGGDAPLSWYLTDEQRDGITGQVEGRVTNALDQVRPWLLQDNRPLHGKQE